MCQACFSKEKRVETKEELENKIEFARYLKQEHVDDELISKATGFCLDIIKKL